MRDMPRRVQSIPVGKELQRDANDWCFTHAEGELRNTKIGSLRIETGFFEWSDALNKWVIAGILDTGHEVRLYVPLKGTVEGALYFDE